MLSTAELSILQARKEIHLFAERTHRMFGMVQDLLHTEKDDDFNKLFSRIEKYENISDNMELEIANYLNQVSEGRLSSESKLQIRAMLREVTEIESIGLGLKYQYNITDPIRLEPSLNYFIENDNISMLDINMNLHYLCPVGRSVKLYPLFGFTFSNWMFDLGDGFDIDVDGDHIHINKEDDHHNECRVGVNIGGGADFLLTNNWIMNFELRYQLVSDFDQAVFNLGFAYRF